LPIILLASLVLRADSYKILVYNSQYAHSHSSFLGQIADILVVAGHNVTSLIPIINPSVADGTSKSLKIHIDADPVVLKSFASLLKEEEVNFFDFSMFNPLVPFLVGSMFSNRFERTCKKVLEEPGLIERLRAENYDVYITENFDVCGMGIAHAISPKALIGSSSTFLFGTQLEEFGVESAMSYRQTLTCTNLDVHSLVSRLWNTYADLSLRMAFTFKRRAVNRVLRKHFGADYPTIAEQSSNVAFVFANSEPLMESAAPTTARIINIPGIGAKAAKPLDQYWEGVLTRRSRTVLLSFGSVAKSTQLPETSKRGILRAIARFPDVTFIWKYEDLEDEFARESSKLEHLVLTKWMPQLDILNHPNLSLFITHGGMASTMETARRGVPGLFVPIFFDQPRNGGLFEFNGLGRVFDKFELHNDEKLAKTIKDVVENDKYRSNARRLSKMLAMKPWTSKEMLIKHVEFAAEFGPSAALRPKSVDMNFIEYHNLDVIVIFFFFSLIFLYASFRIFITVITSILRFKKTKEE
ncbi:hypothetical protein PMAYCL1PPCAC_11542, partial [Pristionchus mayeri]